MSVAVVLMMRGSVDKDVSTSRTKRDKEGVQKLDDQLDQVHINCKELTCVALLKES